jgi:4-hydroxy-tetrahydrodipicolinate synthase
MRVDPDDGRRRRHRYQRGAAPGGGCPAGRGGCVITADDVLSAAAEEIFAFYEEVCRHVSVPVCLYDNPRTTHVTLADELQGRIAALPAIASIKIPGLPEPQAVSGWQRCVIFCPALRLAPAAMPGDGGIAGRLQVWYSVCGGLFPQLSGRW